MNQQNKRKLVYSQAHVNKTSPKNLQMTLRDQELNYANNIKWNTNHNKLLTKTITLVSNRSI